MPRGFERMPLAEPESVPEREEIEHEKLPTAEPDLEKRVSGIYEFVGVSEEEATRIRERYKDVFENQEKLYGEHEKSPAAKELVAFLGAAVPEFAKQYGAEPLKITEKNVHFMPPEYFGVLDQMVNKRRKEAGEFIGGFYEWVSQKVAIRHVPEATPYLLGAHTITHELLHFQSFQSVQGEFGRTSRRRVGLEVSVEGEGYFNRLSEAVIDELAVRFLKNVAEKKTGPKILREHAGERLEIEKRLEKETDKEAKQAKKQILDELVRKGAIDKSQAQKMEAKDLIHYLTLYGDPKTGQLAMTSSYFAERLELNKLVGDVYEKNKEDFKSREDVFNLFARATMSGRLLPLARVIEKTYGKGAFRKLGKKTKR